MNEDRPTLRTIAAALGLSRAAVSMAMRNHPRISPATCLKVQQTAERMGYRSDPLIARLMTQLQARRTTSEVEVIALVMNYEEPNTPNEVFLKRLLSGVRARAARLGYQLEDFNLASLKMRPTQLSKILYTRGIQGVILAPFREGKTGVKLDFKHFATVAPSSRLLAPQFNCTTADQFANMLLIMRRLHKFGYSRVGFYTNDTLDLRTNYRFSGAYLTAISHVSPSRKPLILIGRSLDNKIFKEWLKKVRPQVLVTSEALAFDWAQEAGFTIPEELAFVSTSVSTELFPRPVSGIDELPEQVGSAAVDLLAGQLTRNELGIPDYPKVLNVEGTWTGDYTISQQRI